MPRRGAVEAIARTRPDLMCPSAILTTSKSRFTSPAISAFSAGALPLYITISTSAPACARSSSQPTEGSAPDAPQVTRPGCALISPITSASVVGGKLGCAINTIEALSR